ncbi:MAG: HWE histidine kinase domain-containing protein [Sphingomonadaceae bacterium]
MENALRLLEAGEMERLISSYDWSSTALGKICDWPLELRTVVKLMLAMPTPVNIYCGPELTLLYNDAARNALGEKHPEALGNHGREVFGEIWEEVGPLIEGVYRDGMSCSVMNRKLPLERGPERVDNFFSFSLTPIRNEGSGGVIAVFNPFEETTAAHSAKRALRTSEQRFRTLIESLPQLVWRATQSGKWTWASSQWMELTDQQDDQWQGWGWLDAVHPEDRAKALAAWQNAIPHGVLDEEWRIRDARSGRYHWFKSRATPLCNHGKFVEWVGTSTDVQDHAEVQRRQTMLLAELQHRVRNLLSMIRSIIRQSADKYVDLDDYVAHLAGRIDAIARTQILLTRAGAEGVDFENLIHDELAAMAGEKRFTASGPAVKISAKAAEVMTMVVHELATNSVKYGALGDAKPISTRWSAPTFNGEHWFNFEWWENFDVPIAQPLRRGFGTELIEDRVAYELNGTGSIAMTATGIHAQVRFPLKPGTSILGPWPDKEDEL